MTVYIGDVHGKFGPYASLLKQHADTVQVGDMGIGFRALGEDTYYEATTKQRNPPFDQMIRGNHRFIRGNHDNPAACKKHPQWIEDGTVEDDKMFVGGAISIDKGYRTEGYNWWADEELSLQELHALIDDYVTAKPRVMITHDCPESVVDVICKHNNWVKHDLPSRTRQAFQGMLELHRPEVWVFGHWHFSYDAVIEGTRFVCLDELEVKEIP